MEKAGDYLEEVLSEKKETEIKKTKLYLRYLFHCLECKKERLKKVEKEVEDFQQEIKEIEDASIEEVSKMFDKEYRHSHGNYFVEFIRGELLNKNTKDVY